MSDRISVFVNDTEVKVYRGMTVKHALIAFSASVHQAVEAGESIVVDQRGFRVGLDGSLGDGARIYTRGGPSSEG